jgi:hypothetical protein
MRIYTTEQAVSVTQKLNALARDNVFGKEKLRTHKEGFLYTSLMMCFGSHMFVSTETLLHLKKHFGEWFPTTVAFVILRTMFEALIESHYISKDPKTRAEAYIDYGAILNYKKYKRLAEYKDSEDELIRFWIQKQLKEFNSKKVEESFGKMKTKFEYKDKNGKRKLFQNWSGKSLKEKAKEVDHEIEYDHYYTNFSNFTHANIKLADRFLKFDKTSPYWSMKADDADVGFIFLYASELFACFLTLVSKKFNLGIEEEINNCLFAYGKSRQPTHGHDF